MDLPGAVDTHRCSSGIIAASSESQGWQCASELTFGLGKLHLTAIPAQSARHYVQAAYSPTLCTYRPSLLHIGWLGEAFGPAQRERHHSLRGVELHVLLSKEVDLCSSLHLQANVICQS